MWIGFGHPGTHITSSLAHQQHLTLAGMVQTGWKRFLLQDSLIRDCQILQESRYQPKKQNRPKNPNFDINRKINNSLVLHPLLMA